MTPNQPAPSDALPKPAYAEAASGSSGPLHRPALPVEPGGPPGRHHYGREYLAGGRLFSYAYQMHLALSFSPGHILEVGIGPGVTRAVLNLVDVRVTTVDVQPELGPDIVGSVLDLPLADRSCDVAMCCQVLEHLPFDCFGDALRELKRVARKGVVLSLPDSSPHYEVRVRLPVLPAFSWTGTRARDPGAEWREQKRRDDGHHWEIGYKGLGLDVVCSAIESAGLRLVETFRVPEKRYHRMFKLLSDEGRS